MPYRYRISDAERQRRAERMKRLNADPVFNAAAVERILRLHANPNFVAKLSKGASKAMKLRNADPAFVAASRERMKRLRARQKVREPVTDWHEADCSGQSDDGSAGPAGSRQNA